MSAKPAIWTHERLELLKELWADGDSASVIAARLGPEFTRNSVIGKVHRMQLEPRKVVERKHCEPSRPVPAPVPVKPRHPAVRLRPLLRIERPPGEPLTVFDLTNKTCRWPNGHVGMKDFHFCGATPENESPYCAHHRRIAYQPYRSFR